MFEDARAAFGARAERRLAAEVGSFIGVRAASLAEVELHPEIVGQFEARRKRPSLLAAKAGQRPDVALAHQFPYLLR
ncbi:hypothetical protein D3C83_41480 [compost metagenome]